jgi:Dolichyl-phosphate-mannose-protein mannosyltransferase
MHLPHAQRLRKFRFNLPQRIAAVLLLFFFGQCLWVSAHSTLSESDYRFARCGREMWEQPSALAGYFTSCGNIHDGTLAYRAAGLPLTLDRVVAGEPAGTSTWELRHELSDIALLLRLPFMIAGLALGGCLWWVTRRLFGNTGGYFALGLYCFTPQIIAHSVTPNNEILAAYGLFATVYTAMGVAHALQGPRRKWRPRIVLLTLALGFTAAAHIAAFVIGLVITTIVLAWLAEGRRAYLPTLTLIWTLGAMFLVFASYAFRPDAFSYLFRSAAAEMWVSLAPLQAYLRDWRSGPVVVALIGALALYAAFRRSRYFGNTAPLGMAALLLVLTTTGVHASPWLWAIPFLLTFLGGVYADVLETRYRRPFLLICGGILVAQAVLCLATLPALAQG